MATDDQLYDVAAQYLKSLSMLLCSAPVRNVELNASDGDNVTTADVIWCSANTAYPPVSYYWQQFVNNSWQQLQQQDDDDNYGDAEDSDSKRSVLRILTAGVYVLRCAAYNVFGNTWHNATSDIITLYVVLSGKC